MHQWLKSNNKLYIITACLFLLLSTAVFFMASFQPVQAQGSDAMLWGNQQDVVRDTTGLGDDDPRVIIARIIQVLLGFLGIIAMVLILYAGFIWMTSGGDPSKIDQAKKILSSAAIGLLIILMSFAIVTFILNKLLDATGRGGGGGGTPTGGIGGLGAIGSCTIASVYPEPSQKDVPRNTSIIVTFREEVDPTTICDDAGGNNDGDCDPGESIIPENVRIFITSNNDQYPDCSKNVCNVDVYTNDDKTYVFVPRTYLGSPSEFIWYTVYLTNDILMKNGKGVFNTCQTDYFEWQFECSNKLDLEPPRVLEGGLFPPDDDSKDIFTGAAAVPASGIIAVNTVPSVYAPAGISTVSGAPSATAIVNPAASESGNMMVVMVSDTVAQLQKGANLLGSAILDGNSVNFPSYFKLTFSGAVSIGNSWTLTLTAAKVADTLMIGSTNYIFVSTPAAANQIAAGASPAAAATNIAAKINAGSELNAAVAGSAVTLTALTAGTSGNNIALGTNNTAAFTITAMSGGVDVVNTYTIQDRKDKPRNAVIQINFNEAINPLTVSGKAPDLANYIRVINAAGGAAGGAACAKDSDCLSYTCDVGGTNLCVNDYLDGKFMISNQYRTVEFLSNDLCGVNACGEKIYCLPENGNLRVQLVAANLATCASADDCAPKTPYNSCTGNCYDATAGKNLPTAQMPPNGVLDVALNSLDGNRDENAEGPAAFFNQNLPSTAGDNYQWSFFLTDQIDLNPPIINSINPGHSAVNISLSDPITSEFSKVMMMGSLGTGEIIINNGTADIVHKLMNIRSLSALGIGYWTTGFNIDDSPADGEPDRTVGEINHTIFADTTTYRSQIGSGVKDIYQNCYSPSASTGCAATKADPSCCGLAPTPAASCP